MVTWLRGLFVLCSSSVTVLDNADNKIQCKVWGGRLLRVSSAWLISICFVLHRG